MILFENLSDEEKEAFKVYEGYDANAFTWLPQISCYNYNYYVGLKREGIGKADCIFGISDDDSLTVYYLVGDNDIIQFGYSDGGDSDIIHLGLIS